MEHLDFLNKNLYRRYPIRQDSSLISVSDLQLPDNIFCGARFTATISQTTLFISSVSFRNGQIKLTISTPAAIVGCGACTITHDYQRLVITSLVAGFDGYVIFGLKDSILALNSTYVFTQSTARIEDSLITVFAYPVIKSIYTDRASRTGDVKLTYSNIKEVQTASQLNLSLVDKTGLYATSDRSSVFNNCLPSGIKSINGVLPNSTNNIDIYSIDPLELDLISSHSIGIKAKDITLAKLCDAAKEIPPLIKTSTYLGDIITTTKEEWKGWSQYK